MLSLSLLRDEQASQRLTMCCSQTAAPLSVRGLREFVSARCAPPSSSRLWLSLVVRHPMSTVRLKVILATSLAVVLAHVAIAGATPDDPKFEKFKREMLPQVGRKVTVIGKLTLASWACGSPPKSGDSTFTRPLPIAQTWTS